MAEYRAVAGAWLLWKLTAQKIPKLMGLPNHLGDPVESAFRELAGGARMTLEERSAVLAGGGACTELLMAVLTPDDEPQAEDQVVPNTITHP